MGNIQDLLQMDLQLKSIAMRRDSTRVLSHEWNAHEQEHRFFDEQRQALILKLSDEQIVAYELERH